VRLPVTRLVRVRVGPITLGRLKAGTVRELSSAEVLALSRMAEKAERRFRRSADTSL
jgi:16S rRNA U516 pseudouridylate synthase RsuA-like enzyme